MILKCNGCGKDFESSSDESEANVCEECWKCPKCGCGPQERKEGRGIEEMGIIDEGDGIVRCYQCGRDWSYKAFERAVQKRMDVVMCPCCKGRGVVSGQAFKAMKEKDHG